MLRLFIYYFGQTRPCLPVASCSYKVFGINRKTKFTWLQFYQEKLTSMLGHTPNIPKFWSHEKHHTWRPWLLYVRFPQASIPTFRLRPIGIYEISSLTPPKFLGSLVRRECACSYADQHGPTYPPRGHLENFHFFG